MYIQHGYRGCLKVRTPYKVEKILHTCHPFVRVHCRRQAQQILLMTAPVREEVLSVMTRFPQSSSSTRDPWNDESHAQAHNAHLCHGVDSVQKKTTRVLTTLAVKLCRQKIGTAWRPNMEDRSSLRPSGAVLPGGTSWSR